MSSRTNSPAPEPTTGQSGLTFGFSAYLLWGVLPLYFLLLDPAGPIEIVSVRVLFALVFCVLLLTLMRGWRRLGAVIRDRRTVMLMALAAGLIFVNWLVFILAATTGHVVEASLGYFINPLVTVLLGVLVLRERLRGVQWAAVAVDVVAVLVLALG